MRDSFWSATAAVDLTRCGEKHADQVLESLKKRLEKLFRHERMEGYECSFTPSGNPVHALTVTRDRKFHSRFEISHRPDDDVSITAHTWKDGQYDPEHEKSDIVNIGAMQPDEAATAIIEKLADMDDRFRRRLSGVPPAKRAHPGSHPDEKRPALA